MRMVRKLRGLWLLLPVLLAPAMPCAGQSKLRIRQLSVEDGLSQSSVYSILQDSYGYIWLATGDGLNRYDGKEFISYKSKLVSFTTGQLRDRNINSVIFEDSSHNLWYTADEGVYCMDRRTGLPEVYINKRVVGYSGHVVGIDGNTVWVPITGRGVYSINAVTKAVTPHRFADSFQRRGTIYTILGGISAGRDLWIVDAKGVIRFDKATGRDSRVMLRDDVKHACSLGPHSLAFSVTDGLLIYDVSSGLHRFVGLSVPGRPHTQFSAMAADTASGHLYVAENEGGNILKVDMRTWNSELVHFQDHQVVRMYVDRSQNLWVGTDGGGVYKLDIKPPKFNCFIPLVDGEQGAMVKSIYRSDSGEIWMGLYGRGVLRYDAATGTEKLLRLAQKPQGVYFNCIFKDSSGDIVVALNDRIVWLDERSGGVKRECILPYASFMGPAPPVAFAIVEWRKGVYLVGANHGIYSVHTHGARPVAAHVRAFSNPVYGGWVYGFYKDGDCLYIGRRNGFSKARIKNDTIPELLEAGLPDMPIRHFYKAQAAPFLWLATEQGLLSYNEETGKYRVFDEDNGLSNSFVYALLPENDSTLWISTNKGISRAAIHYMPDGRITVRFTNYTAKDGLQSNEFNSGAYHRAGDGTLMFGGITGINWFRPENMSPNLHLARPVITGVYVDDTLVARDTAMFIKRLVLPYTRNTVSLTFRALEYTLPEQNRYAYKLEGQDNEWVYTTNDKVRFPKLEPGEYTFLLKVSNNEGVWNNEPLELAISISPPYWRTWWFRLLVVLSGAALVALLLAYYTRQRIRARTLELEKQYALDMERLRISKDVHDDIGSGLSRISLLSEMAGKKMRDDQAAAHDMRSISSLSKELVDNMRDLIWVLNPENTTLDSLVARMREYSADYLEGVAANVLLHFPVEVPALNISREVQRNIFSTVKEAVNNCVKHAQAHNISIVVDVSRKNLSITVADDGRGFDISNPRCGGNGLRNMRYRIEAIGGSFELVSQPGKGTTVAINVRFEKLAPDA